MASVISARFKTVEERGTSPITSDRQQMAGQRRGTRSFRVGVGKRAGRRAGGDHDDESMVRGVGMRRGA